MTPSRRTLLLGLSGTALAAGLGACGGGGSSAGPSTPPVVVDQDAQLNDLHKRTFTYFWETTNAANGLAPDNWPKPDFCSIAAVGFALTAYCIGVKSGYVTRADAAQRTVVTLRTLWNGPQGSATSGVMGYKGFFYHFLDMNSGLRIGQCELSSIDTALCLGGVLTAAAYFDAADATEGEIRTLAMNIYGRVEWDFMARPNGLISMGWHPESGLPDHDANGLINRNWDRYNEGMMLYLLAMGSPTHALTGQSWQSWMATLDTWGSNFGQTYLGFSPMFGHQYSHVWYDFRGVADAYMRGNGIDYFINSERATRAQRQYAIQNPGNFTGYSATTWGLTACRGAAYVKATVNGHDVQFNEYAARGIQDGDGESIDDGTIAPTAAAGSVAFAPDICVPAISNLLTTYGSDIYGQYGFLDSFNPTFPASLTSRSGHQTAKSGWVANEYLGIDQGPILAMLENHRSGFVWDTFCRSALTGPIVKKAMTAAGFQPVASSGQWLTA